MENTGADGVAIARGAMYKPWIFAEITGRQTGDKKDIVRGQLHKMRLEYGERFACVFMRKMIAFYLRGAINSSKVKDRLFAAATAAEVEEILNSAEFL